MSTSIGVQQVWEPLDEAVWQAWVEKGYARERRSGTARLKAVNWISIAALLVTAGLWSHLATYGVVFRFVVAAGAIAVMLSQFRVRQYALAAVFGALALLYNPVVPVFDFAGGWQRAVVVASVVPFVATLAWRRCKKGTND